VVGQLHEPVVGGLQECDVVIGMHGKDGIEPRIARLFLRQSKFGESIDQGMGACGVLKRVGDPAIDHVLLGLMGHLPAVKEQFHAFRRFVAVSRSESLFAAAGNAIREVLLQPNRRRPDWYFTGLCFY
jgi:hypothetical protein